MKSGKNRTILVTALLFSVLSPDLLISVAQAQTKSFGDQLVDSLGILLLHLLSWLSEVLLLSFTMPCNT